MLTFSALYALNALSFPLIDPVFLHLGPISIRWYGVSYLLGVFFAYFYGCFLLKKKNLWPNDQPSYTPGKLLDFVFLSFFGIVIGGRLGNVLLWSPSYYFAHPLEIFAIWHGGMAFHGGLIGFGLAAVYFAYKQRLSLLTLFDISATGAPFGIGLVRLCNFINNELWGRVSQMPWAVYFPGAGPLPRHPSQIYEAFLEGFFLLIILGCFVFIFKWLKHPGRITGYFLFLYGCARIISEIFRDPDPAPSWFGYFETPYFTYGMFLSCPMVILGLIFIFYSYFHKQTTKTHG